MSASKKKMEGNPDAGLTSIGNYVFQKTLGEGNFAKVKLAKHKITNLEVAVKIIDKMSLDDKKLSKLYREVRIMKLLHHPHIVKLYEVIETKYTIFLVMEYVSGGELYDYLVVHGRMKEKEARAKFRQILHAVSYCHKKRVIHRDLKAENLLIDANLNVKIADFGFSNQYDPDGKLDTFCGSPPYAAPELFQGKRYTGPEVDVWSLGVILYVLTTGCLPFDGKNLQEMRESVCKAKYRIPFYLSEGCEKLLRKFLVRDSTKRPSLDMLADDPWLNEGFDTPPVVQDVINEELVGEDSLIMSIMDTKFGVDKDTISKCLKENVFDDTMAIYFLLWSEKQKNGEAAVIKIGEQMAIKTVPSTNGAVKQSANATAPPPAAHTPITAIAEEDDSSEALGQATIQSSARRKPASNAPSTVPESSNNETPVSVVPRAGPVKRQRRFTVSGEAEMSKIAAEEKEDPNLLAKLKDLQVNRADESIAAGASSDKKSQEEPVVTPRARPAAGTVRARPVSVAVPTEPEREKIVEKPISVSPAFADKPKEGRKRTNTITGFLKLGRPSIGTDGEQQQPPQPQVQALVNGDLQKSEESMESTGDGSKPRSLRFTFNSNTTSSKHPDEIVQEIINACGKNEYKQRSVTKYLIEVIAPPPNDIPGTEAVKVEVEVCKLPRLKNLHGLRFKRISGASADYKTVCEKVLAGIQL